MNSNFTLMNLLELIKKHELTAYEIAKHTRLSSVGVQKIIDGETKKPSRNTIIEIANYINEAYENGSITVGEVQSKNKKNFEDLSIEEKLNSVFEFMQESERKLNDRIGELEEKLRLSQLINRTYLRSIITHSKIKSEEINSAENIEQSIDKKNRT